MATKPLPAEEARETVSYSLPVRLIQAVAIHAAMERLPSKSQAAMDLIERGMRSFAAERNGQPLPEREPEAVVV